MHSDVNSENDTQTDPWTPEYVVRPGSAPEILTLATLCWGLILYLVLMCARQLTPNLTLQATGFLPDSPR